MIGFPILPDDVVGRTRVGQPRLIVDDEISVIAAEATPQNGDEIHAELLGHGEIDKEVEEAADYSGHVLQIVVEEVGESGGIANTLIPGPKAHLKHQIRDVADEKDED